jgi:hypothetical protein
MARRLEPAPSAHSKLVSWRVAGLPPGGNRFLRFPGLRHIAVYVWRGFTYFFRASGFFHPSAHRGGAGFRAEEPRARQRSGDVRPRPPDKDRSGRSGVNSPGTYGVRFRSRLKRRGLPNSMLPALPRIFYGGVCRRGLTLMPVRGRGAGAWPRHSGGSAGGAGRDRREKRRARIRKRRSPGNRGRLRRGGESQVRVRVRAHGLESCERLLSYIIN